MKGMAMLHDRFTPVLAVRNVEELRGEVLRFTRWLGFDLMSAFIAIDNAVGGTDVLQRQ